MKQKIKSRPSPAKLAVAIVGLLGGAWLCLANVLDVLGGPTMPASHGAAAAHPLDTAPAPLEETQAAVEGLYFDLLAAVGTVESTVVVKHAFATKAGQGTQSATTMSAARGGGLEPVRLDITFVMVGNGCTRATIDGVVVGVGDRVRAGVIKGMDRRSVVVDAGDRTWTYEVGEPLPREFRSGAASPSGRSAAMQAQESGK